MNDRSNVSDTELLRLSRNGDQAAFGKLVQRYERLVARTVVGMLGDCPEADDVGQETFVRFYRSLASFREEAGVGTWLNRIAINLSLNELKRRKRRNLFFLRPRNEAALLEVQETNDAIEKDDRQKAVHSALQKLDPAMRAVVVLRMIEGYSTRETAETLGVPVGTVLSRLARAQKKLKTILTKYLG